MFFDAHFGVYGLGAVRSGRNNSGPLGIGFGSKTGKSMVMSVGCPLRASWKSAHKICFWIDITTRVPETSNDASKTKLMDLVLWIGSRSGRFRDISVRPDC